MSQPPDHYERIFDFTDFSAMQPSAQQPGQKIDQELNAARESLNETIDRLGEIQRDDGKLRSSALDTTEFNGIVNAATATATAAASSASASATTATTKASEATSAATTASGAATTATGAAASAQAQATIASTSATTATTKAAEAADSAASALTSKNSAFASASNATSSAGSAAGHAADAATSASNAASSASTATTQANVATAAANSFSLTAGTTTTGAAGSSASVTVTGSAPSYALNITVPAGPAGSTGATGPAGSVGPAGPAGSTGPAGPAGATGATGPAGTAATIGVGTVTTGAAGSSVSITNVGTSSAAVFNFSIPRGDTGATGPQGPAGAGGTWGSISGTLSSQVDLNNALAAKLNVAGGTLTGKLNTLAQSASTAGFRLTPATATPTSSLQGDLWFDSNLFKARIALSNGGNHNLATESWVTSQSYVGVGYLTSNGYIKFGDTGTHAFTYASKKDYSSTPVQIIAGGYASSYVYEATATLTNAAYDGWSLNFIGSSGSSVYFNQSGTTYDIYYDTNNDLSTTIGQLQALGVSGFSFSYSDDSMGPYYSGLTNWTPAYPTIAVTNSDRFIFDLSARMQEMAFAGSVAANNTLFFDGTNAVWGKPWVYEGYVTSSALNSYANLNVANSWGAKQVFPASNSTRASITIPHGTAPSSPTNGDVWSTTTGLQFRINSATRTAAMLEASNTFTAAAKQTVSHSTSSAGLRVSPVASTVTFPVSGDVWHDSSTGILQIIGHSNSMRGAMSACRAFVNFNGTGTVAIRAGFNVSSITDNGVGDYTVNFTNALIDANYSVLGMGTDATDFTGIDVSLRGATTSYTPSTKTTSAARIGVARGANTVTDVADLSVVIFR